MITEPIRALNWREPYGALMLHGKIETRTWKTNYRGLVLLCASKKDYPWDVVRSISEPEQFDRILDLSSHLNMHNGVAFAISRLVDCRPMVKEDEDKCFVAYHPDLFCHVHADVKAIDPLPWKGAQGWQKVPQNVLNYLNY